MNVKLLQARLSQYGLIWIGAFLGVLLVSLGAILGLKQDFVPIADLLLEIALGALGLLIAVFMVVTLIARQGIATKLILLLLGLLLILPLLWSPVLAIVIAAHVTHAVVEYSSVYAQFRIVISRILFPLAQAVSSGALTQAAWSGFQICASVIGFTASMITLWPLVRVTWARERSAL